MRGRGSSTRIYIRNVARLRAHALSGLFAGSYLATLSCTCFASFSLVSSVPAPNSLPPPSRRPSRPPTSFLQANQDKERLAKEKEALKAELRAHKAASVYLHDTGEGGGWPGEGNGGGGAGGDDMRGGRGGLDGNGTNQPVERRMGGGGEGAAWSIEAALRSPRVVLPLSDPLTNLFSISSHPPSTVAPPPQSPLFGGGHGAFLGQNLFSSEEPSKVAPRHQSPRPAVGGDSPHPQSSLKLPGPKSFFSTLTAAVAKQQDEQVVGSEGGSVAGGKAMLVAVSKATTGKSAPSTMTLSEYMSNNDVETLGQRLESVLADLREERALSSELQRQLDLREAEVQARRHALEALREELGQHEQAHAELVRQLGAAQQQQALDHVRRRDLRASVVILLEDVHASSAMIDTIEHIHRQLLHHTEVTLQELCDARERHLHLSAALEVRLSVRLCHPLPLCDCLFSAFLLSLRVYCPPSRVNWDARQGFRVPLASKPPTSQGLLVPAPLASKPQPNLKSNALHLAPGARNSSDT